MEHDAVTVVWRRLAAFDVAAAGPAAGDAALAALVDSRRIRDHVSRVERAAVRTARATGRAWSEIAGAAGVTRQAAWERWHDLDPTPSSGPLSGSRVPADRSRKEAAMPAIEEVWARIEAHAGEVFHQKRGGAFTYTVYGGCVRPDRTNRQIPRSDFAASLELVPTDTTVPLQHLQGPSFIWAILHDPRVRQEDW